MKFCFNDLLYAFSYALDCVEHDLLGATNLHSKRVAYLSALMGKASGMDTPALLDLAGCAILHDNALTEYMQEEYLNGKDVLKNKEYITLGLHCRMGERNIKNLPFFTDIRGAVLYHHENADGSGPFGKKSTEIPLSAKLIHMADYLDVNWDLSFMDEEKYRSLVSFIHANENILFSTECIRLFHQAVTRETLLLIGEVKEDVDRLLRELLPNAVREFSGQEVRAICGLFAKITDYKSSFTSHHSTGIAQKAEIMGRYYGYDEEKVTQLYFAGAVHDIGKLAVSRKVLEKPDFLTALEYKHIQNHAYYSYQILTQIKGLGEVTGWACLHHEKLNGQGYPFGKTAEELNFEERLMACLDIYQALTEPRPYKDGFSHEKAMGIMADMVLKNFIDGSITRDIGKVFGEEASRPGSVDAENPRTAQPYIQ